MNGVVTLRTSSLRSFLQRCQLLVFDYDGTLATSGQVTSSLVTTLRDLRRRPLRLAMATGRRLEAVASVCSCLDLFDVLVVENGGVLYWTATRRITELSGPPPLSFIAELERHGITHRVGRVLVGFDRSEHERVQSIIDAGYPMLRIAVNKSDAMVLRAPVDKGTGLNAALVSMGVARQSVMAFGDAENDIPLFDASGLAIATANALGILKSRAQLVLGSGNGEGIDAFLREHFLAAAQR